MATTKPAESTRLGGKDTLNADGITSSANTPHLLIPLPDPPEVVDVQLWLHILLSVEGDEWDLGQK